MLQKTYSIYSSDLNDVQLLIETGKNHIACWCKKNNDAVLRAFEFFQYDNVNAENFEALIDDAKLHSRLLTMPVAGKKFFWNTDDVLCLPKEKNEEDFLQQNFKLLKGSLPDANLFSHSTAFCTVAWRVENARQQIAEQCFLGASFLHQFVALLPALQHQAANIIYLFFYPHYFTLCLFKNNTLHYLNTMHYTVPDDVLYFVLNVCKQYEVAKDVIVNCGGFIDEQSKLYEVLYQYLEGFQLLKANEAQLAGSEFNNYPLHYFMPYINYVI